VEEIPENLMRKMSAGRKPRRPQASSFDKEEMKMQMLAFLTGIPTARRDPPGRFRQVTSADAGARLMVALVMIAGVVLGLHIASPQAETALPERAASFDQQGL